MQIYFTDILLCFCYRSIFTDKRRGNLYFDDEHFIDTTLIQRKGKFAIQFSNTQILNAKSYSIGNHVKFSYLFGIFAMMNQRRSMYGALDSHI